MVTADLPSGAAPEPVPFPHFPDRLHAFVWRNWSLVPLERMARVVGAVPEALLALARAMGLPGPPEITPDQQKRSCLTVIRRNWHLLPYEQLLDLLDWTPEQLAYTLREDDFLWTKLGSLKPRCEPLRYRAPDDAARARDRAIAGIVRDQFGEKAGLPVEPLFRFVADLSEVRAPAAQRPAQEERFAPRYCYSYFGLYGDPLLEPDADPYPDGFLDRLAAAGADGIWLQGVLYRLAEFPWEPGLSAGREERLENLRWLVTRARERGIGVYLYLNEPRAMPVAFYETRPEMRGIVEGDHAALCTSHPRVREYLSQAVASLCRAVPGLAGIFTITASENLTNCWSHHRGESCPRCGKRPPAEVIAEVSEAIREGIETAGNDTRYIAWDWGWKDDWAEGIIERLPAGTALMSVSEWALPLRRGGVETEVGEYSLSAVGPGPRARRHWELARGRGLPTLAKIQAGCTWELSAVPYLPVLANVARHIANLRETGVEGLMLGWTLGGYPSPNLELVAEMSRAPGADPEAALAAVARRRFGEAQAPAVVHAWKELSDAVSSFPYHGGVVYSAPLQVGPANLLWEAPTGYSATMVGFPYDDLDRWRAVYPADVFIGLLEQVVDGFDEGVELLVAAREMFLGELGGAGWDAIRGEARVAEAAAIHFRSVANQARFVQARGALAAGPSPPDAAALCDTIQRVLEEEIALAHRLHDLQIHDSRLGFEASNQYYYVPLDLVEKVLNCRDLLDRWLPTHRAVPGS